MALLPKGGLSIAGRKIPWEAVAAVAAVVSVLLVIRARQSGSNVASVGTPVASPYSAAMTGFGNFSPDFSGQLANITEQLTTLEQGINASHTPPPAGGPPPTPAPTGTPPPMWQPSPCAGVEAVVGGPGGIRCSGNSWSLRPGLLPQGTLAG